MNVSPAIEIKNCDYYYQINSETRKVIFENLNLNVQKGEIVSIFGPNGCGKSTILKLLASILNNQDQDIFLFNKKPKDVSIGYIPQDFSESLFPWLSNLDNIAFPLYVKGISKNEAKQRSIELANELSDNIPFNNHPHESSLGQRQLVALARALNNSSEVLLADEPFSALDFRTRILLQDIFQKVLKPNKQITALIVSHQIDDAVFLGDKVVLLSPLPSKIVKVFDIPFERPRSQEIKKTIEFHNIVNDITEYFLKSYD